MIYAIIVSRYLNIYCIKDFYTIELLVFHWTASATKAIARAFLGMEVDDLNDDVKNAIGEIVNMVTCNLKVSYAKIGVSVELAIPTSIAGESYIP